MRNAEMKKEKKKDIERKNVNAIRVDLDMIRATSLFSKIYLLLYCTFINI